MKLWLLSQDENSGYDTFDSIIVAAETEEDAKKISPYSSVWNDKEKKFGYFRKIWDWTTGKSIDTGKEEFVVMDSWAIRIDSVKVEYLGEAKEGTKMGVILTSFNAG